MSLILPREWVKPIAKLKQPRQLAEALPPQNVKLAMDCNHANASCSSKMFHLGAAQTSSIKQ